MKHRIAILSSAVLLLASCGDKPSPLFSLEKTIEGAIIDHESNALTTSYVLNTDHLLLYFSAHWCPPCQTFTPKLVEFYNDHGGGQLFQILFISNDHNEKEMLGYMKSANMPWPGVILHSEATRILNKTYSGQGIPRLVLLNREGEILADSFKGTKYLGPQSVIEQLKEQLSEREIDPVGLSATVKEPLPTPEKLTQKYQVNGFGQGSEQDIAIINGKLATEGSELDKGIVVEKITRTYVEISYEENRYRLYP